jgi:hypothetical protein
MRRRVSLLDPLLYALKSLWLGLPCILREVRTTVLAALSANVPDELCDGDEGLGPGNASRGGGEDKKGLDYG